MYLAIANLMWIATGALCIAPFAYAMGFWRGETAANRRRLADLAKWPGALRRSVENIARQVN